LAFPSSHHSWHTVNKQKHENKKGHYLAWYGAAVVAAILSTFLARYVNQLPSISKKTSNSLAATAIACFTINTTTSV